MSNTASGKHIRRLLGGSIPQDVVDGLEESLAAASTDGLRIANAQTADYTLALGDLGKAVDVNSATAKAVTVPPNATVAYPIGALIEVHQVGAGAVTLTAGVGVTLEGSTTVPAQGGSLLLRKRATNTWTVTELAPSGTYVGTTGDDTKSGQLDLTSGKLRIPASTLTLRPVAGVAGRLQRQLDNARGLYVDTGVDWTNVDNAVMVNWFRDVGDADWSAAFQRAEDSVATGGTILYQPQTYDLGAPVDPKSDVVHRGASMRAGGGTSTRLRNLVGPMWQWTTGRQGIMWDEMYMLATQGHIFDAQGSLSFSKFHRLTPTQLGNFGVYHTDQNSIVFIDNEINACNIVHVATSPFPTWMLRTDTGGINENTWNRCRFTAPGNYGVWIENTLSSHYAYDNVMRDITWEYPTKGCVKILTGLGNVIENQGIYDLQTVGATAADLFVIGAGASGLASKHNSLIRIQRRAGALGSGLVDIRLESSSKAQRTFIQSCRGQNTAAAFTIDLGSNSCRLLDIDDHATSIQNVPATDYSIDAGPGRTSRYTNAVAFAVPPQFETGVQMSTTSVAIKKHLRVATTPDFPSIPANSTAELTVTVTGAVVGDKASAHPNSALETGIIAGGAVVTATDTVSIRVANVTGADIDPAIRTWNVLVWGH